jgi:hypothetical protein
MRIKVKVSGGNFPVELQGKIIEVEVTNVIFPGGISWGVDDGDYNLELPPVEEEASSPSGLSAIFGQELSSLNVDFK